MSTLQVVSRANRDQILTDLIRRRLDVVLSCHGTGGWWTYRSCFVSGSPQEKAVRVLTQAARSEDDGSLPQAGENVGVTFRLGRKKCMFGTLVQAKAEHSQGALLTLRWPEKIHQLQRRAYERVVPPGGHVVPVRFWQEAADSAGRTESRGVKHGQLEDLSAGGMRIQTADSTGFDIGQSYRCVFSPQPGSPALILDAMLRHYVTADRSRATLGFHFVGLEATAEGQRLLDRVVKIVNHFQRAQARTGR